jgi:ParB-like chromosome segregation protein Spo0J
MQEEEKPHQQLGDNGALPGAASGPPEHALVTPPAAIEFHPVANLFPPMSDKAYQALKASIAARGLDDPIVMYQGKLIDGRHRLRACSELGIAPRFIEWDGKGTLLEFVLAQNLHRRHLKEAQRAMVAARIKPQFEEEARWRMGHGVEESRGVANLPHLSVGKSRDHAAQMLSVSARSVESACKVIEKGVPALIEAVDACKLAVSTAADLAEFPKDEQTRLLAAGRAEIRKALQKVRGEQKRANTSTQIHGPEARATKLPPLPPEVEKQLMEVFNNGWVKLSKHGDTYRLQLCEYYLDELNRAINRPLFKHLAERGVLIVKVEKGAA